MRCNPKGSKLFFDTLDEIYFVAPKKFDIFYTAGIKKGLGIEAKSLISSNLLVGGASFELATPAV